MYLYPYGIKTGRPFAMDIDAAGIVWFGNVALYRYDPYKSQVQVIEKAVQQGKAICQCVCSDQKVYLLRQKSSTMGVYEPSKDSLTEVRLPSETSAIWYGMAIPDRPQLLLFDRDAPGIVVWDSTLDQGWTVPFRLGGDPPANGVYIPDENVLYCSAGEPARLVRFSLETLTFDEIHKAPDPGMLPTGLTRLDQTLYLADGRGGKIHAFDLNKKEWVRVLHPPEYGESYAFIGGALSFRSQVYFALSTYRSTYTYDPQSGLLVMKPGESDPDTGIDGEHHHFLDRYLVYNPKSDEFGFLTTPQVPNAYYLICYGVSRGGNLYISGYNIYDPVNASLAPASSGDWNNLFVWQSHPADETAKS